MARNAAEKGFTNLPAVLITEETYDKLRTSLSIILVSMDQTRFAIEGLSVPFDAMVDHQVLHRPIY